MTYSLKLFILIIMEGFGDKTGFLHTKKHLCIICDISMNTHTGE